jgi:hypothetical protein
MAVRTCLSAACSVRPLKNGNSYGWWCTLEVVDTEAFRVIALFRFASETNLDVYDRVHKKQGDLYIQIALHQYVMLQMHVGSTSASYVGENSPFFKPFDHHNVLPVQSTSTLSFSVSRLEQLVIYLCFTLGSGGIVLNC